MTWSDISSDLSSVQPEANHLTSETVSSLSGVGGGWTEEVNQTGPALTEPAGVGSPQGGAAGLYSEGRKGAGPGERATGYP